MGVDKPCLAAGKRIILIEQSEDTPIDGITTSQNLVSSSDLTRLGTLPEHLVIIGGGYLTLASNSRPSIDTSALR